MTSSIVRRWIVETNFLLSSRKVERSAKHGEGFCHTGAPSASDFAMLLTSHRVLPSGVLMWMQIARLAGRADLISVGEVDFLSFEGSRIGFAA